MEYKLAYYIPLDDATKDELEIKKIWDDGGGKPFIREGYVRTMIIQSAIEIRGKDALEKGENLLDLSKYMGLIPEYAILSSWEGPL